MYQQILLLENLQEAVFLKCNRLYKNNYRLSGISDRGCQMTGEESPGFIGQDAG